MSQRRRLRDLERGYGVGQPRDPNIIEVVVENGIMRTMTEEELAHPGCSCFSNSVCGSDGVVRELHQGHLIVTRHSCGAPQQVVPEAATQRGARTGKTWKAAKEPMT